jgi:hypothetical protein
MPKPTKITLLIFLLVLLPVVSHAQTCQTSSAPATTPDSQLTDNGNGTVTDTKTGLMWKKCSEGQSGNHCEIGSAATYSWQAAINRADVVNLNGFAGYSDWRLPNIKELRSIVERQCFSPAINLTQFPNTASTLFWSASPYTNASDDLAWHGDFDTGRAERSEKILTFFRYD